MKGGNRPTAGQMKPSEPSAPDPNAADLKLARECLQRVVRKHRGTPWAVLAQAELEAPLQLGWKEAFMIPPEGEKLPWDKPPGEWKELSREDQAKLTAARERFERFRREQKQKQQEQQKQEEVRSQAKRRIPKL